eukprot:scaffold17413_cov72-Phaeocystis_antarctica.AAC.10
MKLTAASRDGIVPAAAAEASCAWYCATCHIVRTAVVSRAVVSSAVVSRAVVSSAVPPARRSR